MDSRVLLSSFSRAKTRRELATNHRSVHAQHLHSGSKLSNGDDEVSEELNKGRRLCHFFRFNRCVSPCTHTQSLTEISPVRNTGEGLCIQGSTIRTESQPLDIHQNHGRNSGLYTYHNFGNDFGISGRSPVKITGSRCVGTRSRFFPPSSRVAGVCSECGKVGFHTDSEICPSRHAVRYSSRDGSLTTQASIQTTRVCANAIEDVVSYQKAGLPACGSVCSGCRSATFGQNENQAPPVCTGRLVCSRQRLGHGTTDSNGVQASPSAMGGPEVAQFASTDTRPPCRRIDLHGCVFDGLGRSSPAGIHDLCGSVAYRHDVTAHQRVGTSCCSACPAALASASSRQVCSCHVRQFDSSGVHTEARRDSLQDTLPGSLSGLAVCSSVGDNTTSQTHSRSTECYCRRPLQGYDLPHRVDVTQRGISEDCETVSTDDVRSFCHTVQQTARPICISIPRRSSDRSRCSVLHLDGQRCLRLPADACHSQPVASPGTVCRIDDTGGSTAVAPVLDQFADQQAIGGTVSSATQTGSANSADIGSSTRRSSSPKSACLSAIRRALETRGFSYKAVERIFNSRRSSTLNVYSKKWSRLEEWCSHRHLDPLNLSSSDLADFFVYLFEDLGLQPITIKGYRAAIGRIYRLTCNQYDPGADKLLSSLISNFTLERPVKRTLFPKWSLELVLNYLAGEPFEPIQQASRLHLSQKTTFLLLLATASRVSELHALSASEDCLRWNQDGSVSLLPNPAFLAKNRLPQVAPQPMLVQPFAQPLLCPVRMLREYLRATRGERKGLTTLLLPTSKRDKASPQMLSVWVRSIIKEAYEHAEQINLQASAHNTFMEGREGGTALPQEVDEIETESGHCLPLQLSRMAPHCDGGTTAPSCEPGLACPRSTNHASSGTASRGSPDPPHRLGVGGGCEAQQVGVAGAESAGSHSNYRQPPDLSRPAHELRALASTLAYHQGHTLQEIVSAVGWRSSSTFGRFYLRQQRGLGLPRLRILCGEFRESAQRPSPSP